jgi:hypothetical protein
MMTQTPSEGEAMLAQIEQALEQAQDCIRGETPEDISDADAREDTISKVREAMRNVEALRAAAQPGMRENDRHYLSAIRKRLEQLYYASAYNPRLREQLSDEVDWVDAALAQQEDKT